MSQVSDIQWSYLAGVIDGEGHVQVVHARRNKLGQPRVVIAMSTSQPITWIYMTFGGKYRDKIVRANCRLERRWTWGVYSCADVYRILTGVEPYIVLKRTRVMEVREHARKQLEAKGLSKMSQSV